MNWAPCVEHDGFRYYGTWAGNPKGTREDATRCIEAVMDRSRSIGISCQCTRKRGHGPDGLYCKQHNPEVVKKRQEAATQRYNLELEMLAFRYNGEHYFLALRHIADGCKDPRRVARESIGDQRTPAEIRRDLGAQREGKS